VYQHILRNNYDKVVCFPDKLGCSTEQVIQGILSIMLMDAKVQPFENI